VSGANFIPVDVISGVSQVWVLSSLMEIPLTGGSLSLFADDVLLYKVVWSLFDFHDLQSDVDSFV